jgi:hypothetical protein
VEGRLIVGSVLFGIGWGLSGYCPGPALVAASAGSAEALGYGLAMGLGMIIGNRFGARICSGRKARPSGGGRQTGQDDGHGFADCDQWLRTDWAVFPEGAAGLAGTCGRLEVVAINEPADLESMAYLTRFDSTHGCFPGTVEVGLGEPVH